MSGPTQRPVTGVGLVETTARLDSFDFSTADRWELLLLDRGEPSARISFPSPGPIDSAELARELIHPHTEARRRGRDLGELLLRRLDTPKPPPRPPSCSVVLCTHGRPQHLAAALEALARLDPAPLEVLVVDNAPGARDCRDQVQSRGFVYVREDRRGLDNARNSGIRAAGGEVIAFTDDDCIHPPGWLAHLAGSFDDPLVAAVTGPAFPYRLDTPARVRMERQASLTRGLRRRAFDWTLLSALHAGQVGVGANMAIRAALLKPLPEPFPPELDAGTETQSGGDTYVFARLLAAGHRVSYDPRAFVFHQHRADWPALESAVRGYGTGASAALTKLLVEDRELEAPRAALWLLSQYVRTQVRRAAGRADAVETRIAWAYLRGALTGPSAWRRALRTQRRIDPGLGPAPGFAAPTASPAGGRTRRRPAPLACPPQARGEALALSVIVPTVGRSGVLERCLTALAAQTLANDRFEVIVIDDSPDRDTSVPAPDGLALTVHRSGGSGAAVARNEGASIAHGDLLLFLDDDLVAEPDLLERHLIRHARQDPDSAEGPAPAFVIGYSAPAPPRPGLAALGAALWWEDQYRSMESSAALGFTHSLSGNVSIARRAFLEGRLFDPAFARLRREDWEWGFRLLDGGAQLVYEPTAVAAHEYELSAAARIRACRLEGAGDALLVSLHPDAAPFLPLAHHRPVSWRHPLRRLAIAVLGDPRADRLVAPVLATLERGRLRTRWSRLYRFAQRAAYVHGLRAGGWRAGPIPEAPLRELEMTSGEPLARPRAIVPRLVVNYEGSPVAELSAAGAWHAGLADELAALANTANGGPAPRRARPSLPVTVLFGPARRPGDDDHCGELVSAGARVEVLEGEPARHWQQLLAAAKRAQTELIAVPLPGLSPAPVWLAQAEPVFEAPRVALLIGQGLPSSWPVEPVTLHERRPGRVPYAPVGGPLDYLVLRSSALPALERAIGCAGSLGPMAVGLACVEEVLNRDELVAHRNTHGLDPAGKAATPAERERAKLTAWAALLAGHTLHASPVRGALWLAAAGAGGLARRLLRRSQDGAGTPLRTRAAATAVARGCAIAMSRPPPFNQV